MPQNILIIEDETKVAAFIKKGLEENSYHADTALTGTQGAALALNGPYDAIILDINLPGMSGYAVCKSVREKKPGIPILILSALDSLDDKLAGFNIGADDYLVKPFEFTELLARLKSLLKRSARTMNAENILAVANLEINTALKEVKRNGKKIELTAKEFNLLEYLVKNKNKVISRVEIAEKIWEINFDSGTNVIDVYINFLRKKIDRDFSPKLIHTHIGMGYILKEDA